ncbi:hypothetical protein SOVF_065290 [Spinacia oleracea]|nr:hypothetical protein SOVF_065290 [Spinacia oleracea]
MLDSALKFEKVFNIYKEDDNDFANELKEGVPTKEDWDNARVLSLCLKHFYEATKRMSGSLYVTANMHFHEIFSVLASLVEWENSRNVDLCNMGHQMREKFDKYYGDLSKTNVMMLVAVVLDPRYKFRFVKFSLRKLFPLDYAKVDAMCDHLYGVLQRLFEFYDAGVSSSSSKNSDNDPRCSSMDFDGNTNDKALSSEQMKRIYDEFNEQDVVGVTEKSELEIYLDDAREKKGDGG